MRNLAYRYRIYPDETQARLMCQTVGCARFVYNKAVQAFKRRAVETSAQACR